MARAWRHAFSITRCTRISAMAQVGQIMAGSISHSHCLLVRNRATGFNCAILTEAHPAEFAASTVAAAPVFRFQIIAVGAAPGHRRNHQRTSRSRRGHRFLQLRQSLYLRLRACRHASRPETGTPRPDAFGNQIPTDSRPRQNLPAGRILYVACFRDWVSMIAATFRTLKL
jgi:hypothetical protein